MRLSMKKEQPASSTILLLEWLATEQKTTELYVYALKIVVILQTWQLKVVFCLWTITFSNWSQYILCAFFLLFSTCSFDTERCCKHKIFFPLSASLGNHTRYLTKRAKHLNPQDLGWHTPIYICVAYRRVEYITITFSGISHCNLGGGGKTNSGSPLQWPSSL